MTEPIPVDAFYDLTLISDIAISPSGDRVAFVATDSDPEEDERVSSLFVVPTDGSRDPHRLTRASQASNPTWGPDGDRLGFLAARDEDLERQVEQSKVEDEDEEAEDESDENGEEEPKSQLWYFDLELGGDAIQVTDRDEGVSDFDWSPDGDRLVFSGRDPTEEEQEYLDERREGGPIETERLQHKIDGVGWTDTVTTYLFVTDIDGDEEPERLDDAYGGGAFQDLYGMKPRWGPNDRIAFTSCRIENPDDTLVRDLYTIDPDGSDLREHTDADLIINGHEWAPSGEKIAFIASDPDRRYAPSEVYLLEDDEYESITAGLDRTMAWGAHPNWIDDETLYTRIGDEGHTRLVRTTTDSQGSRRVERVFGAQGPYHALDGFEIADGTAVLHLSHPNEGSDLHAIDADDLDATAPEDVSLTPLTGVNDDLIADYAMPECLRVTFESDGWDIDGIVYYPDDFDPSDPDPRPLVVGIHGGPISYDEPTFSFDHAALASRGYLVLRVNYRGGSSYGQQFTKELWGQWGTVEVADIVAGVESLVDRGWADPERVFGHGFSYGGIAQGYLVTQTDLFTAAVPEHGIFDLRSLFGTDDSHNWVEAEFGLPWENKDEFDAASSITDVDDLDTPLLVIGGGQDWRCPPSQSEQLYLSAKKQGIDSKLVVYPDEHHNIGDPDRATHRLDQIFDWYEKHDPAVEADQGDSTE